MQIWKRILQMEEPFSFMEEHAFLDTSSNIDLFALHFVYIPRIQKALDEFQQSWNHHSLSTERGKTPYQLWTMGMMSSRNQHQTAVKDFVASANDEYFGVDLDPSYNILENDNDNDSVELYDVEIDGERERFLQALREQFDVHVDDGNFGINLFSSVKMKLAELIV